MCQVDQPQWSELTTRRDAELFAAKVGYPVLVRPSFVLSGAAMSVASSLVQLNSCLQVRPTHPPPLADDIQGLYVCMCDCMYVCVCLFVFVLL